MYTYKINTYIIDIYIYIYIYIYVSITITILIIISLNTYLFFCLSQSSTAVVGVSSPEKLDRLKTRRAELKNEMGGPQGL